MSFAPPPPPPRRMSPNFRTQDYTYNVDERCKEPIAQRRRIGNKTRVTVSSAQDGYKGAGVNDVPLQRIPQIYSRSRRTDYGDRDYRRSRSSSSSRDKRRRRASSHIDDRYEVPHPRRTRRGSSGNSGDSDNDNVSNVEFDFDLSESLASNTSQSGTNSIDDPLIAHHGVGYTPAAGLISTLSIAGSRWLGSTFDDWDLSVELTTAPVSVHLRPLMTWHHMERPMPIFDEFVSVARRELQQVSEKSLRRVEKMLRKIQTENEKQRQNGREMVPVCVSDIEFQNDGTDDNQNFSASFSAFPVFSLEKLADNSSSVPNAAQHPARPLLQTYTRTVNDKRELAQAVTTRSSTPKGHSLHVSSVWCLVVNNTIITCSRTSLEELRKDFSSIITRSHPTPAKTVCMKVGTTRSWSFPAEELRSWPSLLTTFADDLSTIGDRDARAIIMNQGRIVDAKSWSRVLASTSKFPIRLVLQDGNNNTDSGLRSKLRAVKEALRPQNPQRVPEQGPLITTEMTTPDGARHHQAEPKDETVNHLQSIPALHIFQRDRSVSNKPLIDLAESLHEALGKHRQKEIVSAYVSCPEASLKAVEAALSQDMVSSRVNASRASSSVASGGKLGQITLLAEYIFAFFWPIDCDHVMIKRFWGALHELLLSEVTNSTDGRYSIEVVAEFHHVLCHRVFAVVSVLTTTLVDSEVPFTTFPSQFYEAWLHFLSAFMLLAESKRNDTQSRAKWQPIEQLKMAAVKLEAGEEELVSKLRVVDVEDYEICSSNGIVALILNQLSRDVSRESVDVAQIYGDYCQQLDAKILENPLTRTHQASIRDLQQELEAVLSTLTYQLDVANVFERSVQALDDDSRTPYLPLLLDSRQDAVLATCKNTLAARIDRIKALQARATELGEWHLGEIANNKDRQEAAIMVFTIVTIIFLPLSFVSSVFGMNSSDIRNTDFGQWLYWVVAIPLTIVVIAGSFYWAGALSDWEFGSPGKKKMGYRPLAAEQPVRAAVARRDYVDELEVEKPRRRTAYPARGVVRDYV